MKFILTIDTEADNQWNHGIPLTTENIRFIPRFQELCNRYCIKPTYLVTSEVSEEKYAQQILGNYREKKTAEIGAHLHVWTTPPFEDTDGLCFNDRHHAYATELNESLLEKKIATLTQQIENAFRIRPTSFRSGRFGFDDVCARLLVKYGYLADSSVTPYVDWFAHKGMPNGNGGPNFIGFPVHDYSIETSNGKLLELPVTILPTKWPFSTNESLMKRYCLWKESFAKKITRKLYVGRQPLWLSPGRLKTAESLKKLASIASDISLKFITMEFHSSELMAGCSPFRPDQESIEMLYSLLEDFFKFLEKMNIVSITLTEAALELSRSELSHLPVA